MTFAAARRKVSMEMRDEAVASKRTALARLRADIARYEAMGASECENCFFPFSGDQGALEVGAGRAIWTVTEAAQEVANMTGKPVTFVFNEQVSTVEPERSEAKRT